MTAAQALIVVDVQNAFVTGENAAPESERLLASVRILVASARAAGACVIHLQNDGEPGAVDAVGSEGWNLTLSPRDTERVVRKSEDDGFADTDLEQHLPPDCRVVAVCGLMSEMCVAATVRGALSRGFEVILAHDSHATCDVPPGPGSVGVPAHLAARAAEWSLGDEVIIVPTARDVEFSRPTS